MGFLKTSSDEEEDVVVSELNEKGSVSDLETERDFLGLKSFLGMILVSFMVEKAVKTKTKIQTSIENMENVSTRERKLRYEGKERGRSEG